MKKTTFRNLNDLPQTEADARALLEAKRWGGHPACPFCGGADPYRLTPKAGSSTRPGLFKCKACRKQFSVTKGTIFEDSHIPLTVWFKAIYLICASKKGMSAHQLHRMLGITYKSAWFMAHRLRYAMAQEPIASKLSGVVEADETYIGGQRKWRTGRPGPNDDKKVPVMALVERGGRVRAFPMERVTGDNVQDVIRREVSLDAHMMTDELNVYHPLSMGFRKHETILHRDKKYVDGNIHTNTVEGFFSLLKRGITGVYHHVGRGHLGRYCDEFAFRYDRRKIQDNERADQLVKGAEGKRLTYKMPAGTRPN
jgi:transposase-like protein